MKKIKEIKGRKISREREKKKGREKEKMNEK